MPDIPTRTVTFLSTDVEGSAALWGANPTRMGTDLACYDRIVRDAVGTHRGRVFKTVGDACYAAFDRPEDAPRAAFAAQRKLFTEEWSVSNDRPRIRMALHTGAAEERDGGYSDSSVNQVERLLSAGHGWQILLSGATYDLVGDHPELVDEQARFDDLGEHHPKDLAFPGRIFQLSVPDLPDKFPPVPIREAPGDRYRIIKLLGSGGMANVYLARDEDLGRDVALKMMRRMDMDDEEFVGRFRQEAKLVASLSHPNIVPIYDRGNTADGTPYIVMEYVTGGTVKDLIRREDPLPHRRSASIASQIATALGYAHEHGVVHCDVKPDNVLLTGSGDDIKVADFGIARAAFATSRTRSDFIAFSSQYVSPEQVTGDPVGPWSDLYSLGVVLYEMLTGEVPYDDLGGPIPTAWQHVHGQVRSPKEDNPDVPDRMNDITERLLAKNPEERYPDASELVDALAQSLPPAKPGGGERASSNRRSVPTRIPWSVGRRWLFASLAGLAGLVVVFSLVVSTSQPSIPDDAVQPPSSPDDAVQPQNPGDIFEDNFSDTSKGWTRRPEGDEYGSIVDYADGGYRIYNPRPRKTGLVTAPAGGGRDAIVEVYASRVGDAPSGPSAAGVICRHTPSNYYTLGIRNDGSPVIGKEKDGEFTVLKRDFPSDAFLEGEVTNHIRGECVGDTLTLYVNDQKLLETEDSEFESGQVGLFVVNNGDEPSAHDVWFDDFSVSKP